MSDEDKQRLAKFTDDDIRSLMDMARMYQAGRAAIAKAILYALTGAIVTAVGLGVRYWLKNIVNQ